MTILKKIKKWYNRLDKEECYICGKEISASMNPKSIGISLNYTKFELIPYDFNRKKPKLPHVFYLCKYHREVFENSILSLKFENKQQNLEIKNFKKINLPGEKN